MAHESLEAANAAQAEEAKEKFQKLIERRDAARESATDLQRGVAEPQATRYETTLYRLMKRTDTNPEIVNALNELLARLAYSAEYGESDSPMPKSRVESLTTAIKKATELIGDPDHRRTI